MPLQEVNFFAIVIAIQAQTGGNLAEALGNLRKCCATATGCRQDQGLQRRGQGVGRDHRRAAARVMALVYLTTPDYISLLCSDKLGNLMLMASGIWMPIGIFVMRKMINFKY